MGCEVLCSYLTGSNDNQPTWWPLQSLKIVAVVFGVTANPLYPCLPGFPSVARKFLKPTGLTFVG